MLNDETVRIVAVERQTTLPADATATAWPAWSGDGNRCRSLERGASGPGSRPGTNRAERELARGFASGDERALRDLYERFAGPVLTVAMSRLHDRDLAEEAVQEVFVKAWRAAPTFDIDQELSPWLYQIARRTSTDIARRQSRRPRTVALPPQTRAEETTTFVDAWEAWEVRRALGDLSELEREVIRLTHYVGLTRSQIAQRLGIAVGTVKSRVHRAHLHLAERLAHLRAA